MPVVGKSSNPVARSTLVKHGTIDPQETYSGSDVRAMLEGMLVQIGDHEEKWTTYKYRSTLKERAPTSTRKHKLLLLMTGKRISHEGCWLCGRNDHFKD